MPTRNKAFDRAQIAFDNMAPDDPDLVVCPDCEGTGKIECKQFFEGLGCKKYIDDNHGFEYSPCDGCDGFVNYAPDRMMFDCDNCNGTGRIERKDECAGCKGPCEECPV